MGATEQRVPPAVSIGELRRNVIDRNNIELGETFGAVRRSRLGADNETAKRKGLQREMSHNILSRE